MKALHTVFLMVAACLFAISAFGSLSTPGVLTAEATGANGAKVFYTGLVTVVGGNDGSDGRPADSVTCSPASGGIFALGTTTVSCIGSEGSTGAFVIKVVDTTGPKITVPLDFSVVTTNASGEAVTFTSSAVDAVDGPRAVVCSPTSGSTFPLGTTPVTCSAVDSRGNTASAGFSITIATSPVPKNPDITAEATGPDGAQVTFNTGDPDDDKGRIGSGGCSPTPGSTFPLGTTTVTCPSGNFLIRVVDTTPPAQDLPSGLSVEAQNSAGATVSFTATATDLVDGAVGVACTPSSGSLFAVGTATVTCSATDSRGNTSTGTFKVTVTSALATPPNIVTEATGPSGAIVTFAGGPAGTCSPASGSTFALGTTLVTCSSGATFTVSVVDRTAPVLALPWKFTREATGPTGAAAAFAATSTDLVDGVVSVSCTPASGSIFAIGSTTVSCSASDSHHNTSTGSFTVTITDTTSPRLKVPGNFAVEATGPSGAASAFVVTAVDVVDGAVAVVCIPSSGSTFGFGTTRVSCAASDSHHNTSTSSFNVTVADTTPPALALPGNLTAEATSASGAVVTFAVTASDVVDGGVAVLCNASSGTMFALGTTPVSCSATDAHQNTATGSFTVTVQDTTPPTLTLPGNLTIEATSASGAVATFAATATDLVDGSVPVVCVPSSGSTFGLGTTPVSCSATDAHHNTRHGSFAVTVVDTTPPEITFVSANPAEIWPPDGKLVDVIITVQVKDIADPAPRVEIVSITCNETIDAADAVITGPLTAALRAQRNGDQRLYTLQLRAVDASGNATFASVVVAVPHDQRRRTAGH